MKSAKYRSAIGVAMYISQDRQDIAVTVRNLSQELKEPTEQFRRAAQRLASYMNSTMDYASLVHAGHDGASILHPDGDDLGQLPERYSDADWSGNKHIRRSMSSASIYADRCCVYKLCKTQRCISLSSTESELRLSMLHVMGYMSWSLSVA